jgi:DNA polymerase
MRENLQFDLDTPPPIRSLRELAKAENKCKRCPLYKDATQAVPGEGRRHARLMLVGEQPGDKEDLAGRPFVGPAGRILDRALVESGIPRTEVFVTNAVKHFKHEMRGKRRLHKRPNAYEIERCRIWLDIERAIVKPMAIVALGATAARSLFGRTAPSPRRADACCILPTTPPPSSPSIRHGCCGSERRGQGREYRNFVADLRLRGVLANKRPNTGCLVHNACSVKPIFDSAIY